MIDKELLEKLKALPNKPVWAGSRWLANLPQHNWAADPESAHIEADDLFCEVLESLGFKESVEFYKKQMMWYI